MGEISVMLELARHDLSSCAQKRVRWSLGGSSVDLTTVWFKLESNQAGIGIEPT